MTPSLRAFALVLACLLCGLPGAAAQPLRLQDTGWGARGAVEFSPQYPLWTDGADKRRWLRLPAGSFIDASKPDAWVFPRGTRLWKEFSYAGRPVETRYIERGRDGQWRFATYLWNEAGTEAVLAPPRGVTLAVPQAPQRSYRVPARTDCLACHGSTTVPVLGLSALQLSPERDPMAPGAKPARPVEADLRALVARGWLRGLPRELLQQPPRIAAATAVERAALGYLHGNCAHCHNPSANRVPVALTLQQRAGDAAAAGAEVMRSLVGAPSRYQAHGASAPAPVVEPGRPDASVLVHRMQTREPRVQMPPLGTSAVDAEGLALIRRWITTDLSPKEPQP